MFGLLLTIKIKTIGVYYESDIWDYLKGENPYRLERLPQSIPLYNRNEESFFSVLYPQVRIIKQHFLCLYGDRYLFVK